MIKIVPYMVLIILTGTRWPGTGGICPSLSFGAPEVEFYK